MILYCFTEINQIKNIYMCLCVGSKDVGLYAGLPSYTIVYRAYPGQGLRRYGRLRENDPAQ